MKLPKFLQPNEATVEEYQGDSAYGPEYADPYQIEGYMEEDNKLVRNSDGDEVVSSSQFFTSEDVEPPEDSKLTFEGTEHKVISSNKQRNALTGKINHVQINLK